MAKDPQPPAPLLEVADLSVSLGHPAVEAVRQVGFSIRRGEILGLAGESGSGKSVTSLALTRLLPAAANPRYAGIVRLAGVEGNLLRLGESSLRRIRGHRIAHVFQEPSSSFNPVHTIRDHLGEMLGLAGVPREDRAERMAAALSEVGIEPSEGNLAAYPAAFSGGMLQRLAIACALVPGPDLLVADEVTTALDTSTQKRIVDLLLEINAAHGMAVLFISHNLALLRQVAARMVVMRHGRIVEQGGSQQLLDNPRHHYTRALVDAVPRLRV